MSLEAAERLKGMSIPEILSGTSVDQTDKIIAILLMVHSDISALKNNESITENRTTCLEADVTSLQSQVMGLKRDIKFLKNPEKKNNLVLFKYPDNDQNNNNLRQNITTLVQSICEEIPTEAVVETKRIGVKPGERPVLITFSASHFKGFYSYSKTWKQ